MLSVASPVGVHLQVPARWPRRPGVAAGTADVASPTASAPTNRAPDSNGVRVLQTSLFPEVVSRGTEEISPTASVERVQPPRDGSLREFLHAPLQARGSPTQLPLLRQVGEGVRRLTRITPCGWARGRLPALDHRRERRHGSRAHFTRTGNFF